jgi:hypothetical protein
LQRVYFTSAATIRIRLRQCGLLEDHRRLRPSGGAPSQIGDIMREYLPGVFNDYLKRCQQALDELDDC